MTKVLKNNILGIAGEVFTQKYCKENDIKFKKATSDEDQVLGIDCYIGYARIPTDVKNTEDIFICQILEDGIINTRHPFKTTSKATHYWFVKADAIGNGKFIEHIPVKEKLLKEFIDGEEKLKAFSQYLISINHHSYKKYGMNLNQASFKLKKDILNFCKTGVNLVYSEPGEGNCVIDFKLTKKNGVVKTTSSDVQGIRESIKNKLKQIRIEPIKKFKKEIIKIYL